MSIVMPTLNEATRIEPCLQRLRCDFPDCELVVADGGSTDGTAELAAQYAEVIRSAAGRATQMNAGTALTSGDILWFIHADCHVPADALDLLRQALLDPSVVGGGLEVRFDQRSLGLDYLAVTSNVRARRLNWIFGDQAMFVRRRVFDSIGGFPEIPLMEDLEMSRILRRRGRLVVLPTAVTASARRLVDQGVWRMTVLMQWLKLQYLLGVDPQRIRRRYEAGTRRGRRCRTAPT
ncbi:MAG: TIGR04283 family arsenosugar biosynthesis glycosyltransferase, partial [Actinobacteria bacterium]|nr:TIGR04283 family arsenosugar biosynthesis glycosyltransferase [Actinomycetota bacterium]